MQDIGWRARSRRLLGTPRHNWVHNSKMSLGEAGRGGVDWTDLSEGSDRWRWRAVVHKVMELRVA
jgi:hypothetical protein